MDGCVEDDGMKVVRHGGGCRDGDAGFNGGWSVMFGGLWREEGGTWWVAMVEGGLVVRRRSSGLW